jgi:hypothetical protein
VDVSGEATLAEPTPAQLSTELAVITAAHERVGYRLAALQSEAEHRIRSGSYVPGWSLESKPGRLEWSKPLEEVLYLGALCGVDLSRPDVITPTQAKKLGVPVEEYTERAPGKAKLVPTTAAPFAAITGE